MIQTTLAYVGDYLGKYFFGDIDEKPTSRVVYGDNESYFNKVGENKIKLPGLIYNLTQLTLPHGPSKPTRFRGDDNSSGTTAIVYNSKRAMLTCSMCIYCANAMEHFEYIQKYLELQSNAVIPVIYHATDKDSFEIECALSHFEDPVVPPAGKKGSDYDVQGLIYQIECGFSIPTLFLTTRFDKIIRCIRYDKIFSPWKETGLFYHIQDSLNLDAETREITDTQQYKIKMENGEF